MTEIAVLGPKLAFLTKSEFFSRKCSPKHFEKTSGYGYPSHDAVWMKCWLCHSSGIDIIADTFRSAVPKVLALALDDFCFSSSGCTFYNSWEHFLFFQIFPNFRIRG